MKRLASLLVVIGLLLAPGAAAARSDMTLDAFVTQANRIPINPASVFRADARRLMREVNAGFGVVNAEIRANRAAGRTPAACPPEKVEVNPRQLLSFLNAIPQPRRARMTVPDGLRAWMADRYPCLP